MSEEDKKHLYDETVDYNEDYLPKVLKNYLIVFLLYIMVL